MKTGLKIMEENGMKMNAEMWTLSDFHEACLPMVVACAGCDMTMTLPSPTVRIDDELTIWCKSCAGE